MPAYARGLRPCLAPPSAPRRRTVVLKRVPETAASAGAERAPRLAAVSTEAFVVAPIRLALGIAGLGAALALGLDRSVALLAFGFGTALLLVSALADPRRRFLAPGREPLPAPPDARVESKLELARAAVFPSTVGVSLLAAVALAFDATLGALLAGALAGMGLAAAVSGARVAARERGQRVRFYVERGGPRLFERPD